MTDQPRSRPATYTCPTVVSQSRLSTQATLVFTQQDTTVLISCDDSRVPRSFVLPGTTFPFPQVVRIFQPRSATPFHAASQLTDYVGSFCVYSSGLSYGAALCLAWLPASHTQPTLPPLVFRTMAPHCTVPYGLKQICKLLLQFEGRVWYSNLALISKCFGSSCTFGMHFVLEGSRVGFPDMEED